jgi:hypothetical protein
MNAKRKIDPSFLRAGLYLVLFIVIIVFLIARSKGC